MFWRRTEVLCAQTARSEELMVRDICLRRRQLKASSVTVEPVLLEFMLNNFRRELNIQAAIKQGVPLDI